MNHEENSTDPAISVLSMGVFRKLAMSKVAFSSHINNLNEGKHIFTSLLLGLSLFVLVILLDLYSRRHLQDLECRNRDLERKLLELQDKVTELRNEREIREAVLRNEIGKAREEFVTATEEFEAYQKRLEEEREVDRNVDMEEKLCLIRGLKELAGEQGMEVEAYSGGEGKLIGLGIHVASLGSDERSTSSPKSCKDEAEMAKLRAEEDEAWGNFEQALMRENGELVQEEGSSPTEIKDTNDGHDPRPETLIDMLGDVGVEDFNLRNRRRFPLITPEREFPLMNKKKNELRDFTDPGVQTQIDGIFELE